HFSKSRRWRLGDEIGYLCVEWAIDDDTQCPLAWVMLGNEKHCASEIRIEHIRMSDQQCTSKAARRLLLIKITHVKLETATRARATQVTQSNLARQTHRRNDEEKHRAFVI